MQFFLATLLFVAATAERACNNAASLCAKPYNTITYLGSHDSPFLRDSSTPFSSFGNQFFNATTQLNAGVRFLSAQLHVNSDAQNRRGLHICHALCTLFDAGSLNNWLWSIRLWMDRNPNEVVTLLLVNADGVHAREIEGEYSNVDIAHYGFIAPDITKAPPPFNETHLIRPTLGSMIDKGERLVTFVNPLKPDQENAPYLLDEFAYLWENSHEVTDPGNFTCQPDRPQSQAVYGISNSGRLFMMNHFLYWQQAFGIQVLDTRTVNETKSWDVNGGLGKSMLDCAGHFRRQPTFVLVDFNVGPAIASVDIFNKVDKPVGRKNVTTDMVFGDRMAVDNGTARSRDSSFGLVLAVFVAVAWS